MDTSSIDTGMAGAASGGGEVSSLHSRDSAAHRDQQHPVVSRSGALPSSNRHQPPENVMAQQPEGVVVAKKVPANDLLVERGVDTGGTRDNNDGLLPSTRNLCLGTAVGVTNVQLVTFAASFREVAPSADLVLFVDARSSDARREGIIEK